nr:membrane dipeptidase [uncultured Carboxylicivirga sp.]
MSINNDLTRRKFLISLAGLGTIYLLKPYTGWAFSNSSTNVEKIVADSMGIDAHNHMDVPFDRSQFAASNYELAKQLKASGLSAICMTFCVDRPNLKSEGEAFQRFLTSLDEMDAMLLQNKMERILSYSDVVKAWKNNKVFVVQSVEGAHFIEGEMDRIKVAYDRGLRHLGLMHDNQTAPPVGDIYTEPDQYNGLTEYGKDIIKMCNKLGILVDLTHCSNKAIDDALSVSTKPIIISHTGLNTQLGNDTRMAQMMMPRLISKEQAKKVADAGGVIGVWTHLAENPAEYAKNIEAMVDTVGINHVCIGTDTKMAPSIQSNNRYGQKTNESWNGNQQGFYYTVVDELIKLGFKKNDIMLIGGGNYWRVFNDATTV